MLRGHQQIPRECGVIVPHYLLFLECSDRLLLMGANGMLLLLYTHILCCRKGSLLLVKTGDGKRADRNQGVEESWRYPGTVVYSITISVCVCVLPNSLCVQWQEVYDKCRALYTSHSNQLSPDNILSQRLVEHLFNASARLCLSVHHRTIGTNSVSIIIQLTFSPPPHTHTHTHTAVTMGSFIQ